MTKTWMQISQSLMGLSLLPWGLAALMLPMAFDLGVNSSLIAGVVIYLCYPLPLLLCTVMSWRSYRKGSQRAALIWTSAPLLVAAVAYA